MASLYPDYVPPHQGHPRSDQFQVIDHPGLGKAVQALASFRAGIWIARFDGLTVGYLTQHSLQKARGLHLVDPWFAGLLSHACAPNVMLDMKRHNVYALLPIKPGDLLSIDYETTEDELFAPFVCRCGAPVCRGHIRGRLLSGEA